MSLTKCPECDSPMLLTQELCLKCSKRLANRQSTVNNRKYKIIFGALYTLSVIIYLAALTWLILTIISISHGNASNEAIVIPGTIVFISITCCSITGLLMRKTEREPFGLFAFYILSGQLFWCGLIWLVCTIILTSHGNLSNGAIVMPAITTFIGILCCLCSIILQILRD